jgi:hypothetical protein
MRRAVKRRIRDRKFIPYQPDTHLAKAFAVSASKALSWDLFLPVSGYRPHRAKSKRSYKVSLQRQQSDWSKLVLKRDRNTCQNCQSKENLEAHHVWPQGWFPHLRYVVKNGLTLCRTCHGNAYHAREITPLQFQILTEEVKKINANLESDDFWTFYTAGIEKGRVLSHNLLTREEMSFTDDEKKWFLTWAKLNDFFPRTKKSAKKSPIKDLSMKIDSKLEKELQNHQPLNS